MSYRIVPTAEEHIAGFHAVLDRVARESKYLAFLEAPPRSESEAFLRKNMANGNPQFVAIVGDGVLGWCDITAMERPISAHCGVLGMGILQEFRGKGIGRALIETTLAAARKKGLMRIELQVREGNTAAISLYESVGFRLEGVKRAACRIDGRFYDLLMMGLLVDDGSRQRA